MPLDAEPSLGIVTRGKAAYPSGKPEVRRRAHVDARIEE